MSEKLKKTFSMGERVYTLEYSDFPENIDVDDLLRIDASNILGEVLTFPLVLNRFGLLLADIDHALAKKTFEHEQAIDDVKAELAKAYDRAFKKLKKDDGILSPTGPQIEKKSQEDEEVLSKKAALTIVRNELIEIQRDRNTINNLYWSAKSKDEKINKLSEKLRPIDDESEIIDGMINNVLIKSTPSLFSRK